MKQGNLIIEVARPELKRHAGNFFLAGDYMRSPIVNGAMASGVDAAREAAELLASRPG